MNFHIYLFFLSLCLKTAFGNEEQFIRLKISSDSLKVPKTYFELKSVDSKIVCGAICTSQKAKCSAFLFKKQSGICHLTDVENGTIKNDSLVDFTYISLGKLLQLKQLKNYVFW
jgi:hypothetical protein